MLIQKKRNFLILFPLCLWLLTMPSYLSFAGAAEICLTCNAYVYCETRQPECGICNNCTAGGCKAISYSNTFFFHSCSRRRKKVKKKKNGFLCSVWWNILHISFTQFMSAKRFHIDMRALHQVQHKDIRRPICAYFFLEMISKYWQSAKSVRN